ncbi:GNAT family N-acetyltransferase [Brachybacterium sp. GCM10030252]|uniref:GNAT family N-acetyltransferase n=1 Tax=Brachybacterium sp. GCM10030252 TaxID=3273380 RepID=UPI0036226B38
MRLSPVSEGDLEELFSLHADARAFVDDLTEPLTARAQMRWVLSRWIEHWQRHGSGYFAVRTRGRTGLPAGLLGVVGLATLEADGERDRATEAASASGDSALLSAYWRLDPEAVGRGVATEAMAAVLDDPVVGARECEVVAVTAAGNAASRALAARLGFRAAAPDRPVPGDRPGDVLLVRPGA